MSALPLSDWRDFFVMIGTAAGVIIGAAFIVVSLTFNLNRREFRIDRFVTPTVVNLGSVLIGSAILVVPTLTPLSFAMLLGASGLAGLTYNIVVAVRIWKRPLDPSSRVFYAVLPIITSVTTVVAALAAWCLGAPVLETLATALVALLIIGMRNVWDMATFVITRKKSE